MAIRKLADLNQTEINGALSILRPARELIAAPEHWTQRYLALSATGAPVLPRTDAAICWCSSGALLEIGLLHTVNVCLAGDLLTDNLGGMPGALIRFNDTHSHAEVLAVWDRTIAAAEHALAALEVR